MNDYNVKKIYEEMELHLISSMKRNLGRHLKDEQVSGIEFKMWQAEKLKELKRYQKENKSIVKFHTAGLSKEVADILKEEFKQGHKSEINKYNKLFDKKLSDSFFKLNDRKANALINVVNHDLDEANKAALRMMNDTYRQTVHKAATFASNGVMTQKQAVDMATKDFLSRGLAVIEYKDGKRVNIASYAQMAVRTASQRAMLMGEGEFRKSIGETNVIISKHGTACKLCVPHEGNVYIDDVYSGGKADGKYKLLSDAMKQGLFHPNCRHGISTYYGLDDEDEQETTVNVPEENNNEDAARLDREIQKEKRKVAGFQSPDNLKTAQQRLKELEAQKQQVIPNNISEFYNYYRNQTNKILTPENLNEVIGYNELPTLVSKDEFNKIAAKNKYGILERGFKIGKNTSIDEIVENYKHGSFYVGEGIFGSGTYTAYGEKAHEVALSYSAGAGGWSDENNIATFLLSNDAKIANYNELKKIHDEELDQLIKDNGFKDYFDVIDNGFKNIKTTEISRYIMELQDMGVYASIKGYDAIDTYYGINSWGEESEKYLVILNRKKMIMYD